MKSKTIPIESIQLASLLANTIQDYIDNGFELHLSKFEAGNRQGYIVLTFRSGK